MKLSQLYYLVLVISVLVSCTATSNQDGHRTQEIMKSREIKKVSEADILNKSLEIGNLIADSIQKTLSSKLVQSMQSDGLNATIKFCSANAISLTDSLSKEYSASIRRTSFKYRNPANEPDSVESQLLNAYQHSVKNKRALRESANILGNEVLFTKPILLGNPVCLNCHGKVGKELSSEDFELLQSIYPEDKATGYSFKEFRGMWSIRLERKMVVNAL
ncbi:MAG: DUF3365 domain-containing protein [Cyclobacteriaceae bacterium]